MKISYIKLPASHFGALSRDSAWLGPDHLLTVRDFGVLERYQRYYYKDIQGLSFHPNLGYKDALSLLAVPPLLLLALAGLGLFGAVNAVVAVVAGVLGVPAAALWTVHAAKGQTCKTLVHTAVGDQAIAALCRVRAARKALELLVSQVEASQGRLDPRALSQPNAAQAFGMEDNSRAVARGRKIASYRPGVPAVVAGPTTRNSDGAWTLLTMLEVSHALAAGVVLLIGSGALVLIMYSLVLIAVILTSSVVLARSIGALRRLAGFALGHGLAICGAAYIAWIATVTLAGVRDPGAQVDYSAMLSTDDPAGFIVGVLACGGAALLALYAVFLASKHNSDGIEHPV